MNATETLKTPDINFGAIITDCTDSNARIRQQARFASLFGIVPEFVDLGDAHPDLEAAGQIVDVVDALESPVPGARTDAVILVNVAPRGDDIRQKWPNGTPFCSFEVPLGHGKANVVSTFEGRTLSLARNLGLVSTVQLFDIPTVVQSLVDTGKLTEAWARKISETQFRSLEFAPLAAYELACGTELPSETVEIKADTSLAGLVWKVDNFGNLKTTALPRNIQYGLTRDIVLENGHLARPRPHLTDVPTGECAVTIGSSGFADERWLEVAIQRGRATDVLNLGVGSKVL